MIGYLLIVVVDCSGKKSGCSGNEAGKVRKILMGINDNLNVGCCQYCWIDLLYLDFNQS